jgi:hypothetical protein
MVKVGLFVRLNAKTGRETEVENLLQESLPLTTAQASSGADRDA